MSDLISQQQQEEWQRSQVIGRPLMRHRSALARRRSRAAQHLASAPAVPRLPRACPRALCAPLCASAARPAPLASAPPTPRAPTRLPAPPAPRAARLPRGRPALRRPPLVAPPVPPPR
eukprot:CAMPEP_0183801356 /NCGR_PEP_ID=MMETSP0803_2-20130417/27524_1 /TAXON_ID=195967 /ORGANISM="Crustomastix stigmata, Strain CCMP3273" /LENGTH=117 /DNA_ID=CAMNT_0026046075 /DNA_START=174 /DNA_END=523 /DNA_ORIENTATION=-